MTDRYALIAGNGQFPLLVLQEARKQGVDMVVLALREETTPDIEKLWLDPSVLTKIEAAGTLSVIPKVGRFDAAAQSTISVDLTRGRQRVRRLGKGALLQLEFYNAENNQDTNICLLFGTNKIGIVSNSLTRTRI